MKRITTEVKKQDIEKKLFKDFNIDFDKVEIILPDGNYLDINVLEILSINKDLPADVLDRMSKTAVKYARFSIIRADLETYKELLTDRKNIFMLKAKQTARKTNPGKTTESFIEEKAILKNLELYKDYSKKIRDVNNNIEKIKRIMAAIEIQGDQARSICSYNKKEWQMDDLPDAILGKRRIYK
jgi:hypothetical protein